MSLAGALPLNTRVLYEDRPGLIVARCKPVGEPWRYDILLDRENRIALLVPDTQFVTERELSPPSVAERTLMEQFG